MRLKRVDSDLRSEYASIVHGVLIDGKTESPRGQKTRELTNYVLQFDDARQCTFPTNIGRGVSLDVMAAECMQWLSGTSDLKQLINVSATFTKFTDDGHTLYGAYGPRTRAGLARAVYMLANDPSSRQATVSIWTPYEAFETDDLPCTVSWTFIIRGGKLHMTTLMRSNDVWTGLAYDVPIMARIQSMMAWALGVDVGSYTHHAVSMHIYEVNFEAARELTAPTGHIKEPPFFHDLEKIDALTPVQLWQKGVKWARDAHRGERGLPDQFSWYSDRLRGTEQYPRLCGCGRYVPSEFEHDHDDLPAILG